MHGSDFDSLLLPTHLEVFAQNFQPQHKESGKVVLSNILAFVRGCTHGQLELISEVSKLVRLLLVMPATNAGSERSFSALRRIKTYLRSTMSQQRMNNLMLLHIHKSRTDHLNLVDIANDFIVGNDHRKQVFDNEFRQSDLQVQ